MDEPITLFGERVADRRERLREILATKELEQETEKKVGRRVHFRVLETP
jgi:hypothetical protein